jgi:hypothetical protein
MSTAVMPESRSVTALAKLEALRFVKHPVFLIGFVANALFLVTALGRSEDYYNGSIITGFFVGVFGMIAMFRLTRSMQKTEEALGSTPVGVQDRVRALCLATVVPGVLGLVSFAVLLSRAEAAAPWVLGTWSEPERFAIFFGEVVVAAVGGPLLGIAAARWWRFPGAVAALVVSVLFVVLLGEGLADSKPQATWAAAIRLLSPWAQFTSANSADDRVASWGGNPWFHLGWSVALCVLAVLGALLKGAEGAERKRLFNRGAAVGVVGLVLVALAVGTGDEPTLSTPTGVTPLTQPIGG